MVKNVVEWIPQKHLEHYDVSQGFPLSKHLFTHSWPVPSYPFLFLPTTTTPSHYPHPYFFTTLCKSHDPPQVPQSSCNNSILCYYPIHFSSFMSLSFYLIATPLYSTTTFHTSSQPPNFIYIPPGHPNFCPLFLTQHTHSLDSSIPDLYLPIMSQLINPLATVSWHLVSQHLSTCSWSIPHLSLPIPPHCCYSLWLSSSLLFSQPFSKSRNPLAMILPVFQSSSLPYFCVSIFLSYCYPLVVYCYPPHFAATSWYYLLSSQASQCFASSSQRDSSVV